MSPVVLRTAELSGYTPLQARIIAGRLRDDEAEGLQQRISPRLSALNGPRNLPDIEVASDRLVKAIVDQEVVVCATDFDADGVSAQSVIQTAFLDVFGHPRARFRPVIGLRLRDGYGVSDNLVDRILTDSPDAHLVVTADQGSSDESRISVLKEHGIEVVVTDHHAIPEAGPPASAYACVNPVRKDSEFEDHFIAGVHVAFLTMCAVREKLINAGILSKTTPSLAHLADIVCLGTVADAVSFSRSINNRAITMHGLSLMNSSSPRPCWAALRKLLKKSDPLVASDIGFTAGALVNAAGRLSDAMKGVKFLMSKTIDEAMEHLVELDAANRERREIEASMRAMAMPIAEQQVSSGRSGLVVFMEQGHPGVHGVVCSRVTEAYGRPTGCFSPKVDNPDILTGSFRSIAGVNVRDCLAEVHQHHPDIQLGWGGHAGAAGSHLKRENLTRFMDAFEQAVQSRTASMTLAPTILVDGELPGPPGLHYLPEISALSPYGREFDMPVFTLRATVETIKPVGDGSHLQIGLKDDAGHQHASIWFRAIGTDGVCPVEVGQQRLFAYELGSNTFRDRTTAQLKIVSCQS